MYSKYVYKVFFNNTNQFYIGSQYGKNANYKNLGISYFTSSPTVQRLLFCEGINNVEFIILNTFLKKEDCRTYESKLIAENSENDLCLNISSKTRGKVVHSKERNDKISKSLKRRWKDDPDFRLKQTELIKGRTWVLSEENKAKVVIYLKPENRLLGTKSVTDSIWINNGKRTKRIKKDELIPVGFKKGRI